MQGKKINVEILRIRPGAEEIDQMELERWAEENIACIREFYDGELDLAPYSTDANIPFWNHQL